MLYRTKYPIKTLGVTIPANSFVKLKFQSESDDEYTWFEFLGLFSGLTKIIKLEDVIFDSYVTN